MEQPAAVESNKSSAAAPNPADIAAWNKLSRQERIERFRQDIQDGLDSGFSESSPDEIREMAEPLIEELKAEQ